MIIYTEIRWKLNQLAVCDGGHIYVQLVCANTLDQIAKIAHWLSKKKSKQNLAGIGMESSLYKSVLRGVFSQEK